LTGPLGGTRLPAEVKRFIVRAVTDAKAHSMPIAKSCDTPMIDCPPGPALDQGPRPQALTESDLADIAPIAKVCPHAITTDERAEIVKAARQEARPPAPSQADPHAVPQRPGLLLALYDLAGAPSREPGARYHHRSRPARPDR